MATRKLYIFKHADKLGNAPAHALFDRICICITRAGDVNAPPRKFSDYSIKVDKQNLPGGVELIEQL